MATNEQPKPDKFTVIQKTCVGMFISSATVYEILQRSTDIQKSLGLGYPWFLMALTVFGLSCAAISGPQILELLEGIKTLLIKKK